jgi:hypothetical protein
VPIFFLANVYILFRVIFGMLVGLPIALVYYIILGFL